MVGRQGGVVCVCVWGRAFGEKGEKVSGLQGSCEAQRRK